MQCLSKKNELQEGLQIAPSKNALCSFHGKDISNELVEDLAVYDVAVCDSSLVEIIPSNDGATALMVTNIEGNAVNRDVLVVLNENNEIEQLSLERATSSEKVYSGEFDLYGNDSLVVAWAVRYNELNSGMTLYYQPQYAQLVLYNNTSKSVTNMLMQYNCRGYECSLPNFTNLTGSAGTYFTHTMTINQPSVVKNKFYTATNAYRTDRAICIDDGGHNVHIEFKVNGNREFDDWDLDVPYFG